MADVSDSVRNAALNQILRGVDYVIPAGAYLSLHATDPGRTGAGEVTGGSYARQSGTWNAASNGICTLASAVSFTGMPAGPIAFFGIWSASSGGTFITGGVCTARDLGVNDTYTLTTATQVAMS